MELSHLIPEAEREIWLRSSSLGLRLLTRKIVMITRHVLGGLFC
jgi:hypothetical protein